MERVVSSQPLVSLVPRAPISVIQGEQLVEEQEAANSDASQGERWPRKALEILGGGWLLVKTITYLNDALLFSFLSYTILGNVVFVKRRIQGWG